LRANETKKELFEGNTVGVLVGELPGNGVFGRVGVKA
jgi:hypothetical protein